MLRRVSRRRELSVLICLTLSGKLYKRHFERAIKGADVIAGLRHLRQQVSRPLIIIRDRLNAHRAKVVKQYLASEPEISVEWLPAYAPELNPEEQVHGNVKQHLRNATPETVKEIRQQVDRGRRRFIRRQGLKKPNSSRPSWKRNGGRPIR